MRFLSLRERAISRIIVGMTALFDSAPLAKPSRDPSRADLEIPGAADEMAIGRQRAVAHGVFAGDQLDSRSPTHGLGSALSIAASRLSTRSPDALTTAKRRKGVANAGVVPHFHFSDIAAPVPPCAGEVRTTIACASASAAEAPPPTTASPRKRQSARSPNEGLPETAFRRWVYAVRSSIMAGSPIAS